MFIRKIVSGALAVLVMSVAVATVGCEDDWNGPVNSSNSQIFTLDISDEDPAWDYMLVGEDGSSIFIDANASTDVPSRVFLKPRQNSEEGITVFFKANGLPEKMVVDNHVLYFGNFNGNKYDLAVIYPDSRIDYLYDLESDVNWDSVSVNGMSKSQFLSLSGISKTLDFIGNVMPVVTCGVSVFVPNPVTVGACASAVISSLQDYVLTFAVETVFDGFAEEAGLVLLDVIGCAGGDFLACAQGLVGSATLLTNVDTYLTEERAPELAQANGIINGGRGDVKVTLSWDNLADVDLHVVDPYGEEIYFAHKNSRSGGELDFDNTYGYGPENTYWALGTAPDGTYEVYVKFYGSGGSGAGNSSSNYTVLITAFGNTKTITGVARRGEGAVLVATFTRSGITVEGQLEELIGPHVVIDMYDSYGDGWNHSGALRIEVNGEFYSNARVSSGSSSTYRFPVSEGDEVDIYWTGNTGSDHSENAFIAYYAATPPVPAFNTTSWSGSNALVYRLRGSLSNADLNQLLGTFTVDADVSSLSKKASKLPSQMQTHPPKSYTVSVR